jgi:hypothetical protein
MEISSPHPLFLCPKIKWKHNHDVWFSTFPIGKNQLRLILDQLISNFPSLKEKILTNKARRGVAITWMEEVLIPCEYMGCR